MKDKKTLITIIVLLAFLLPLAVIGSIKHFSTPKTSVEDGSDNPNKEFILNNKVYFYVDGKLVSTYNCDSCTKADTIINDTDYHTNYYKDGSKELSGIINDYFSIFKKNDSYILYNYVGKSVVNEYSDIKNYNVDATSEFLITNTSDGWGVVFFEIGKSAISNEYSYIALPAHLINKKLDSSMFIAQKDNTWSILKDDGTILVSDVVGEIVDFNDNYYITYTDGYHIYNYDDIEVLNSFPKDIVYGIGEYLVIVVNNQAYIYKDLNGQIINTINIPEHKSLYFSIEDAGIDVIVDGNVIETLEFS